MTGDYYKNSSKIDKVILEMKVFKKKVLDRNFYYEVDGLINMLKLFLKKHVTYIDRLQLLRTFDIELDFPNKIEKSCDLSYNYNACDLRNKNIITIDSHFKNSSDDAISFEETSDGYLLGIYITDVASFVSVDTVLYDTAFRRGESIYTNVDNSSYIPMFPFDITRDFFSLNKDNDKYVIAHFFKFSKSFDLVDYNIRRALINVSNSYTFEGVDKINSSDSNYDMLYLLHKLTDSLKSCFNLNYYVVREDDNSVIRNGKYLDSVGSSIITISTLFLNSHIAQLFNSKNYPYIYRVNNTNVDEGLIDISHYSTEALGHVVTKGNCYGHISNPIRNFASYLNQYFEISLFLGDESYRDCFIEEWKSLLPDIVDRLNYRLSLNDEYCDVLEKTCNKRLTKKR